MDAFQIAKILTVDSASAPDGENWCVLALVVQIKTTQNLVDLIFCELVNTHWYFAHVHGPVWTGQEDLHDVGTALLWGERVPRADQLPVEEPLYILNLHRLAPNQCEFVVRYLLPNYLEFFQCVVRRLLHRTRLDDVVMLLVRDQSCNCKTGAALRDNDDTDYLVFLDT